MPDKKKTHPSTIDVSIQAFAQVVTSIVESVGWPGALVIFAGWFIVHYATDAQKHRIIETFVLGTGVANTWPLLVVSVTFVLTLFAQRHWYLKKLKILADEIDREGKVKSELQSGLATKELKHATTKTKPRGK